MSIRKLYLDDGPGEVRGVVTLDGRPERLMIARGPDDGVERGSRFVARVRRKEASSANAFLDLGEGREAMLALAGAAARVGEGASIEVEVTAEARRGKTALVALIGPGQGAPRQTSSPPSFAERLLAFAPAETIETGLSARLVADEAQDAVLAIEHPLVGGGWLAIESTRALVAVDVDLGGGEAVEPRRAARRVNLAAIGAAARLLRLKALGGLVAIDLVGKGHDGAALSAAAEAAFAVDQPGVSIGAINRFGLMTMVKPWRDQPVAEILCGPDGRPSTLTLAFRLLRALEREGWADRGARLNGRCSPAVAAAASHYMEELTRRLGARVSIEAAPDLVDDCFEIGTA